MTDRFDKLYIALKFRLHGMGYFKALNALEIAKEIHDGYRKDGKTPEFQHQLEIALYIMTLKDIEQLEDTIIVALLHDTDEDYPHDLSHEQKQQFDGFSIQRIEMLNKHRAVSMEEYFRMIGNDRVCSLVKGVDRINNFQSMHGAFTIEKQIKYAVEVKEFFLPMLKRARKKYPKQMDAYYNIENMLKSQYQLVTLFINASLKKAE